MSYHALNANSLVSYIQNTPSLWSYFDQQKLPREETWIDCQSPEHMIELIQALKVR